MAHVSFTSALPWWGALLIVVGIAVVAWLAYAGSVLSARRRHALIALRFVTLAALVVFLMGPVRIRDEVSGMCSCRCSSTYQEA
jgi:hypothetical protein